MIPYTANQMFDLVANVATYPEFLPFCIKTCIHEESELHMVADMYIGYKAFKGEVRSRIRKSRPHSLIIEQTHGSLKYLTSSWLFKPAVTIQKTRATLQPCTEIQFLIDFEPASWLVGKLITPLMEGLGNTMMQAFIDRATLIYGNAKDKTP